MRLSRARAKTRAVSGDPDLLSPAGLAAAMALAGRAGPAALTAAHVRPAGGAAADPALKTGCLAAGAGSVDDMPAAPRRDGRRVRRDPRPGTQGKAPPEMTGGSKLRVSCAACCEPGGCMSFDPKARQLHDCPSFRANRGLTCRYEYLEKPSEGRLPVRAVRGGRR